MVPIPWMVAMALQQDGWYLRQDIIWAKPNPMPESVTDRPTKAHEYIFLLTKSSTYFYDAEAIKEPAGEPRECGRNSHANVDRDPAHGTAKQDAIALRRYVGFNERYFNGEQPTSRNKRSVWSVPTNPYPDAHFATFPPEIPKLCILAGSKIGDTILDPFAGSGTTAQVALELARKTIAIELNPTYIQLIHQRTTTTIGLPL